MFAKDSEIYVPAKFVSEEREMMYPLVLTTTRCNDENEKVVQGIGAKAAVHTPNKALIAKHGGNEVSGYLAEKLRLNKKGFHIITAGPSRNFTINGNREDNGVFDLAYYVEIVEVLYLHTINIESLV